MKVAFLSYDFGEYCVRLAGAVAQQAEVLLMLPRQLAEPHVGGLNGSLRYSPFDKPRYRQPAHQIRTALGLIREIVRFDPEVIHLQQGHLWFNFALPLLRRYPLVMTIHDPRHHTGDREGQKVPQGVMDFGFRHASQVIVHGEALKDVVVKELGFPGENVHVIPHVVLGDQSAASDIEEEPNNVLFFGRIWEYKGLDYLIRAEPLISAQAPEVKIVIAGQGEDFARYREMMANPNRFVVYNEYVSDARRAELFRQASVVVLPYVEATQSGVVPVAYTFGKPVVATRVGSLPEIVDEGHTGYLVPPRDERALAEAITRLLLDGELRHRLGANGKRKIDSECSPAVVARKTLDVYHQAVAKARSLATNGRAR